MLTLRIITVGTLKEAYWRDAVAEYKKRLSGFCRVEGKSTRVRKTVKDSFTAGYAGDRKAVIFLIQKKSRFLTAYIIHIVFYAVFFNYSIAAPTA